MYMYIEPIGQGKDTILIDNNKTIWNILKDEINATFETY